jgi:hypothetical protein
MIKALQITVLLTLLIGSYCIHIEPYKEIPQLHDDYFDM